MILWNYFYKQKKYEGISESPSSITMAGRGSHCNCMEGKALQNKEYTMLIQPLKKYKSNTADYVHNAETEKY